MKKMLTFLICISFAINQSFSQTKIVEIVVPLNDSVYTWKGNAGDQHWYGFYTSDSAIAISFNDSSRTIGEIRTMCGRSSCPGGFEMNFYNNGIMESKGTYGFTTDIDSLKHIGGDGFMDYVGKTGAWYYWNEKGFLMRKENWRKAKLISTANFSEGKLIINQKKKPGNQSKPG